MSVPAWKQAILDRKKQQQKDEELKHAEEEAYLASLPPWKRSLFLKKKKEAGGAVSIASAATTSKPATTQPSRPAAKQQQTSSAPSTSAVQNRQTTSTANKQPTWGRKESPKIDESQPDRLSASNTNNNNTDSSSSWSRKPVTSAVTPSTQKEASPPASVRSNTENIPLWKRNLMQKQEASKALSSSTAAKQPSQTPGLKTNTSDSSVSKASDSSTARTSDTSQAKPSNAFDDIDDSRLASLPPWKRDLILRKRAAAAKEKEKQAEMAPAFVPKITKRPSQEIDNTIKESDTTDSAKPKSIVKRISDDKISMWRKAEANKTPGEEVVKPGVHSQNEVAKDTMKGAEQMPASQEPNVDGQQTTKLVNGVEKEPEDKEAAPPILKGKDPWAHLSEDDPQFKALPAWKQAMILRRRNDIRRRSNPDAAMHIKKPTQDETDFAEVPAWKQETMLRKSQDKAGDDDNMPDIDDDMPEWKKEKLREQFKKDKNKSKSLPTLLPSNKQLRSNQPSENIPEWKKEAMKGKQSSGKEDDIPEWKKEQQLRQKQQQNIPAKQKDDIPEWKKEAVKQKQQQKPIEEKQNIPLLKSVKPLSPERNTQSYSPTKTSSPHKIPDDDDDDVPCTNIDDLSDSEESDDATGSYDVNPEPSTVRVGSASSGYGSDTNSPATQHGMRHRRTSSKSILVNRKTSNPVSAHYSGFFYYLCGFSDYGFCNFTCLSYLFFSKSNAECHGMKTRL